MSGGEFRGILIRARSDLLSELSSKIVLKRDREKSPGRLGSQIIDKIFKRDSKENSPRSSPIHSPNTSPRNSPVP